MHAPQAHKLKPRTHITLYALSGFGASSIRVRWKWVRSARTKAQRGPLAARPAHARPP
jgi:hypothetical protein